MSSNPFGTTRHHIQFYLLRASFLLSGMILSPSIHAEKPSITLSSPDIISLFYHTSEQTGFIDEVLGLAFERMGYQLKIQTFPTERSLKMADAGAVDGELIRARGIENQYPNLIRSPEAIANIDFMIFSRTPLDVKQAWQTLVGKSVGVIIGMKLIERNIPAGAQKIDVRGTKALFELLTRERVDCIIFPRLLGEAFLKKHGIQDIITNKPELTNVPIFTYFHNSQAELAPALAQTIRAIKADGSYGKLVNKHWGKHSLIYHKKGNSASHRRSQ